MDYVVAGFGIGAILALIGFALWELYGNVEEPGKSWLSRAAIGFMLGALVIWSITGVSLISHIDDSTGSQLVLLTTLVSLVAIAGVTFFYWRADRALAATLPRPVKQTAPRQAPNSIAAPAVLEDIELTEWDSWPEREAAKPDDTQEQPDAAEDTGTFEAEVAAEAVEAPEPEPEAEAPEPDEDESPEPPDPQDVPPANEIPDVQEKAEKPEVERPTNVLPFRLPAPPESPALAAGDDAPAVEPDDAEEPDSPNVAGKAVPAQAEAAAPIVAMDDIEENLDVDEEIVDEAPIDQKPEKEEPKAAQNQPAPTGFESSLLADVDGSLAAKDGGYQSPLLSDLGSDKLEGVGLAKWNPDARLTEENEEDAPPQSKSGRRR